MFVLQGESGVGILKWDNGKVNRSDKDGSKSEREKKEDVRRIVGGRRKGRNLCKLELFDEERKRTRKKEERIEGISSIQAVAVAQHLRQ